MTPAKLWLLLMDFFSKEKLNYSCKIPVVDYFSHALVINRKIIFCKCQKLCVQCRNTHLVCVDFIEFIHFCSPKYSISFKIKARSMILLLLTYFLFPTC